MKLPLAGGRALDYLALDLFGLRRKRWLWIFRERDKTFRKRCTDELRRTLRAIADIKTEEPRG